LVIWSVTLLKRAIIQISKIAQTSRGYNSYAHEKETEKKSAHTRVM